MKDDLTPDERRNLAYKYLKHDIEMIRTDYLIDLAIRLLNKHFGPLSNEAKDKLSNADMAGIELVFTKLVTSKSIEEIISHLK